MKPLKAAKKAQKDMDEDDMAYLEKKRAGTNENDTDLCFAAMAY